MSLCLSVRLPVCFRFPYQLMYTLWVWLVSACTLSTSYCHCFLSAYGHLWFCIIFLLVTCSYPRTDTLMILHHLPLFRIRVRTHLWFAFSSLLSLVRFRVLPCKRTVTQEGPLFVLENCYLRASIEETTGKLTSLVYKVC
jgi:hypothetical protein